MGISENQIVVYQPNETSRLPEALACSSVVSEFATTQHQQNPTIAKSAQVELIRCDKPEGLLLKRVSDVKEAA